MKPTPSLPHATDSAVPHCAQGSRQRASAAAASNSECAPAHSAAAVQSFSQVGAFALKAMKNVKAPKNLVVS